MLVGLWARAEGVKPTRRFRRFVVFRASGVALHNGTLVKIAEDVAF